MCLLIEMNKQARKQTNTKHNCFKCTDFINIFIRFVFCFCSFSVQKVLTDIGSDVPAVPSKPIGAPAAHSLITSPNYNQLSSPHSNYATDVTTTTNIISNGNHSPVVREISKSLQKSTEALHIDTTNSEPIP